MRKLFEGHSFGGVVIILRVFLFGLFVRFYDHFHIQMVRKDYWVM